MKKVVLHKIGCYPSLTESRAAVEELLSPLGGMKKYVKPGSKVLLKPNVGVADLPETGKVTDPKIVLAAAEAAISAGASEVWVAESSVIGIDTGKAFTAAGYDLLKGVEKISLIDLKKEKVRQVNIPDGKNMKSVYVFERVFQADVIINMPKMKTIASSVISMGMKNLKGLIRDDSKKECHYTNLHEAIAGINKIIKPHLTIIDGTVGRSLFEPIEHGILLAGEDIVALDTVGAICAGVAPETVQHLCLAETARLGVMNQEKIQVIGEKAEGVKKEYRKSADDVSAFSGLYPEIAVSAGDACSGCVTVLEMVFNNGKAEGWFESWEGKLRLAIGPKADLPDDGLITLCLGNCLESSGCQNIIKGCPFISVDVRDWLRSNIFLTKNY